MFISNFYICVCVCVCMPDFISLCVCVACVCLVSHRNLICTQIAINLFVYYSLLPLSLSLLTFLIFAIIIRIFAQPFKQFYQIFLTLFAHIHNKFVCRLITRFTISMHNYCCCCYSCCLFISSIFFGIYCIYLHIYQFSSLDYILVKFKTMCRQLVYQQSVFVCVCVYLRVCVCAGVNCTFNQLSWLHLVKISSRSGEEEGT